MQTVKELMVPIEKYVTVQEDITVQEAINTLETIRNRYQIEGTEYKPRQLIVLDRENRVVGRLSQMDVVMSLEPKYKSKHGDQAIAHTSASGLSPDLLKEIMQWYALWGESFDERCRKVLNMLVRNCMKAPRRDEYINENESLEVAVHQIVMGRHQSLLVMRDESVVGILRLSDIFDHIAEAARSK